MPVHIRTIDPTETEAWLACLRSGFLASWSVGPIAQDVQTLWDFQRVWAAVEDDAVVGTTRSWATELTVPGGALLPGSAVAGVSVLPTHRRRGILRGLLAAESSAARERGEAVAVLWASDARIYGRFGFGAATRTSTWTVDTGASVVPGAARPGALAILPPSAEARDLIRGVFEAHRVRQPGEIRRREFTWDDALGLRPNVRGEEAWVGTLALHRDADGAVDGYVRYHLEERWERRRGVGILHIDELHALTDEAYRDLWRLACTMEFAGSVQAADRPPHERLPWLVDDPRTAQPSDATDGLWLALLDPARALAARTYLTSGRLVLGIADAAGSVTTVDLDATPDGARCRGVTTTPDLTVDARDVAAAYLGGATLRDATVVRGVDEHRPGALALLDRLLRTLDPPWCSTFF